jgi:hypothetical protein
MNEANKAVSAHDVAQDIIHGGLRVQRASAVLSANYTPEFLASVASQFAEISGAKASTDPALRNLGTTFRRAVPTDADGNELCKPLTLKVKQRKSVSGGKFLSLSVIEYTKPAPKPAMQAALRDALRHAYALGKDRNPAILSALLEYINALDDAGACGESDSLNGACMAVKEELAEIVGSAGIAEAEAA